MDIVKSWDHTRARMHAHAHREKEVESAPEREERARDSARERARNVHIKIVLYKCRFGILYIYGFNITS